MQQEALRILLIEDDKVDQAAFFKVLAKLRAFPNTVECAETLHDAQELLSRNPFDVLVCDLGLPDAQGIDTVARITSLTSAPLIALTGLDDSELGLGSISAGAQDYISKGELDAKVLERALRYAVARGRHLIELSEQNKKILSVLHERETLLKEVHHRVKNNLQVISSLLRLQSLKTDNEETRTALGESCQRVLAMAMVHERLYQSYDVSEIEFAEYLKSIGELIRTGHMNGEDRVRLQFNLEPLVLPLDIAMPCALIVSELMTNSFKHAFPEGRAGTITVTLRSGSDRTGVLTVQDDGVGFPVDLHADTAQSLGLGIVRVLSRQITAQAMHRPSDGSAGVTFQLVFPLSIDRGGRVNETTPGSI